MPHISNNKVKIYHKEIVKPYKIAISYNQDFLFYAKIPREYEQIVHHLTNEEMKTFSIEKWPNKSAQHRSYEAESINYEAIITAENEGLCLSAMKKLLEFLIDKAIVQTKVIILFFNPDNTTRYNNHRFNPGNEMIGMQMGLTYAVETVVGEKRIYSTYREYEAFGEKKIDRKELNLYDNAATIIPDTPENRETLEYLYTALKALKNKIAGFTKTPEKLLEFIQSNVKLLSNEPTA